MKIGVIGATGKAGSLIASEAYARGNKVTAIIRNKSKLENDIYEVIEKDIFDLKSKHLKDFDVVVNAFGTAFDKESAKLHVKAMKYLIKVFEDLPNVRLIVIGGAASLYKDGNMKRQVLEDIPEEWRAVPQKAAKALDILRKSDVNWTFFSPAVTFDYKGARTGKYTLGNEFYIVNEDGESYISYSDYAIALVDEIENEAFIKRRFTAVSKRIKTNG